MPSCPLRRSRSGPAPGPGLYHHAWPVVGRGLPEARHLTPGSDASRARVGGVVGEAALQPALATRCRWWPARHPGSASAPRVEPPSYLAPRALRIARLLPEDRSRLDEKAPAGSHAVSPTGRGVFEALRLFESWSTGDGCCCTRALIDRASARQGAAAKRRAAWPSVPATAACHDAATPLELMVRRNPLASLALEAHVAGFRVSAWWREASRPDLTGVFPGTR